MQALLDSIHLATPGTDACRIFHGRGGLYPGCEHLSLDWYAPVWVLTSFQPLTEDEVRCVQTALAGRTEPLNLVLQFRQPGQGLSDTRLVCGQVPQDHGVWEQGAQYRVHVLKGQNHGLFLDMAHGRQWLREHSLNKRVLNLFAYTCAFSVAALQGGATDVVNVDMAAGALAIGQHNHRLNGLEGARFLPHDLFKSWGKVKRLGPYDIVVADPPSHQKGSFVATKDYARVVRRLPELLVPGGRALLCLNAPELPVRFLADLVAEHAPALQWRCRLDNPAVFADVDPDRTLKVMVFQQPV